MGRSHSLAGICSRQTVGSHRHRVPPEDEGSSPAWGTPSPGDLHPALQDRGLYSGRTGGSPSEGDFHAGRPCTEATVREAWAICEGALRTDFRVCGGEADICMEVVLGTKQLQTFACPPSARLWPHTGGAGVDPLQLRCERCLCNPAAAPGPHPSCPPGGAPRAGPTPPHLAGGPGWDRCSSVPSEWPQTGRAPHEGAPHLPHTAGRLRPGHPPRQLPPGSGGACRPVRGHSPCRPQQGSA